jgi:hypothetical protein
MLFLLLLVAFFAFTCYCFFFRLLCLTANTTRFIEKQKTIEKQQATAKMTKNIKKNKH